MVSGMGAFSLSKEGYWMHAASVGFASFHPLHVIKFLPGGVLPGIGSSEEDEKFGQTRNVFVNFCKIFSFSPFLTLFPFQCSSVERVVCWIWRRQNSICNIFFSWPTLDFSVLIGPFAYTIKSNDFLILLINGFLNSSDIVKWQTCGSNVGRATCGWWNGRSTGSRSGLQHSLWGLYFESHHAEVIIFLLIFFNERILVNFHFQCRIFKPWKHMIQYLMSKCQLIKSFATGQSVDIFAGV